MKKENVKLFNGVITIHPTIYKSIKLLLIIVTLLSIVFFGLCTMIDTFNLKDGDAWYLPSVLWVVFVFYIVAYFAFKKPLKNI